MSERIWDGLRKTLYKSTYTLLYFTYQLYPLYLGKIKSFSTILVCTSDYLRYLRIQRTVTMTELAHDIWKMSPHYLVKCRTCSSAWGYVWYVGCSEKSRLWCVASNVTASVHSDHLLHGLTLPVFFAIDKSHPPACCAEIQPVSQQAAAATRPYRGIVA